MVNNNTPGDRSRDTGIARRTVLKSSALLGALGIGGASLGTVTGQALPDQPEVEDGTVAYQYFHAEWSEIEADVPRLDEAGIDAIWVQQPAESSLDWEDLSYDGEPGYYDGTSPYGFRDPHPPLGYQPVDLRNLDSSFGTETELESLIETCHDHGIEVIVDVVLNHMANENGPDGYVELPQFDRNEHFHDNGTLGEDCQLDGEAAEYECNLLGLPSFNHELAYVQDEQREYIQRIANLGADGLRYDAAAHVWPWYFEYEVNPLADDLGLWRVGEVWKYDVNRLLEFADTGMTVFDYALYDAIVEAFEGGSMEALSQDAARGVVHHRPSVAVTFAQNHDTVGPNVEKDQPEGRAVELAEAFVMTYAGMPMIYRSNPEDRSELDDGELRDLVAVSQEYAHGDVIDRYVSTDTYVYEREGNLLAAINKNEWSDWSEWVQTSWTNTTLVDQVGGREPVTTNDEGWVELTVPAEGVAMYVPDTEPTEPAVEFDSTEYSVLEGETTGVDVTVSAGENDLEDDVTLTIDNGQTLMEQVSVNAEESTAVVFEVDSADLETGEYDLEVAISADSDTATLAVGEEGAGISLEIQAPTAPDESVYFTGDTDELTNWGGGIEGTNTGGDTWEVTIEDAGEFEWKTRRGPADGSGNVWESGDNHTDADRSPAHQGWKDGFENEITLRMTVDVGHGKSVYFTGDTDELTNWGGGIEGTWTEGNVWEVTIENPGEFEWKTRRGPSGETGDVWEAGSNHDETDLHPYHQGWDE
ncbi:alpha-amylase domain-containing protein [Natrinema ejinorense]|uniref:alpha-amylase domain-containing protein n=1 Tax=Natrinema ejinorense TaxID=373386 RepID=UPI001FED1FF3|nr:alpha-amylase domain-containing protein [Natrinema ejinorense]